MKIGVICEGEKTDGPVLKKLLEAEFPDVTLDIRATSKKVIFSAIGPLIDDLVAKACQHVAIVWDLHPVGTQMSVSSQTASADPCQLDQRRTLLEVAQKTSQTCQKDVEHLRRRYGFSHGDLEENPRVCLICFCESFDAAFLSDHKLLQELASSEVRRAEPHPKIRTPENVHRPQEVLRQYFRRGHNRRLKYFNKCEHNIVLAKAFVEGGKLQKLRSHPGYSRLVNIFESWISSDCCSGGR